MTHEITALMRQAEGAREEHVPAAAAIEKDDLTSGWVNLMDDRPARRRSSRNTHRSLTTLEKYRKVQSHVCEQRFGFDSLKVIIGLLGGLFFSLIMLHAWMEHIESNDRIVADRVEACEKAGMNFASPAQLRHFEDKHPVDQLLELQRIKFEGQRSFESWIRHEECAIYCAHVTGTKYHVTDVAAWARQEHASQQSKMLGSSGKEGIWESIRLNFFHAPQGQYDTSQNELPEGCQCSN